MSPQFIDWETDEIVEDLGFPAPADFSIGYIISDHPRAMQNRGYLTHEIVLFNRGRCIRELVMFESTSRRRELLAEMARILSVAGTAVEAQHGKILYSYRDFSFLDRYLNSFSGDLEVAAFFTFLFLSVFTEQTTQEELEVIAEEHVSSWRRTGISTSEDAAMYWHPAAGSRHDYSLYNILVEVENAYSPRTLKEILDGCRDDDYQSFLKLFYYGGATDPDMTVDVALDLFPPSASLSGEGDVEMLEEFTSLRLDYPEQREFLRGLTVGDLFLIKDHVDLSIATPRSAIAICRDWVLKSKEPLPLDFALESYTRFYRAARHITNYNTWSRVHNLYLNNHKNHVALAVATEHFESVGAALSTPWIVVVTDLLFGGLVHKWAGDVYHVDYVLELLKSAGMSADEIVAILKRVSDADLKPEVSQWERYSDNYDEVRELSVELVLDVM